MPRGYQPKLTDEQIEEIRTAPPSHRTTLLAIKYGVSKGHISQIRTSYARSHNTKATKESA